MYQTTHKLLGVFLLLHKPSAFLHLSISSTFPLLTLFSCSLIRCKLIAPHMGDGTRLVSILIMVCGLAAGNTLPICSQRICQMIGVYTPHPLRSVCHSATSYISITHRIPRRTSPNMHRNTHVMGIDKKSLNIWHARQHWLSIWSTDLRNRLHAYVFLMFLIFTWSHISPLSQTVYLLPLHPHLPSPLNPSHLPSSFLPNTVLLLCCPINHPSLINRPTVPNLPTAPTPHLAQPCCPAGIQRTPTHTRKYAHSTHLERSWQHWPPQNYAWRGKIIRME